MDSISNFSQMTQISKYELEEFSPEMSFQLDLNNIQKENKNYNIVNLTNDLKSLLSTSHSESVKNLTQCFICLCTVNFPLSCPKCNNFACKKCLEDYFGDNDKKLCPLCKQEIKKSEFKKNKTIREIEKIIYKEDKKSNKISQLSKLVNEKKKMWENQENYLNQLINKVLKYQENLKQYRKNYEIFFLIWKNIIDGIFNEYEKKIKELIDILVKYNMKYNQDSKNIIIKSNELKEKNKVNSKDITSLVNEILFMERNHFNEENKKHSKDDETKVNYSYDDIISKSQKFFITPLFIIPNISNYTIGSINIEKKDFNKGKIKIKDYNVHIGNYKLEYIFDQETFSSLCKLDIKNDRRISIFIILKKIIDNKSYELIPMKNMSNFGNYFYETRVDLNEFKDDESVKIRMESKIQIFSVIV